MASKRGSNAHVYIGTFLIAFVTLAVEVTLARLLSVVTWYHLAFFAIATAMLGMTAGATTVYLKQAWFTGEKLHVNIARACLGYALCTPLALVVILLVPVTMRPSIMSLFALTAVTLACSTPFYFSGIAITAVLTRVPLPIGKLYAADLLGASLGCLFVLAGLELFDAPSLILLASALGGAASLGFAWRTQVPTLRRRSVWLLLILAAVALANSASSYGIRPFFVKGRLEPAGSYLLDRWNSFSRVAVSPRFEGDPQFWGESPRAPADTVLQHNMTIDGLAGTTLRRFTSPADIDHLRYDVTNIGYYLRPRGSACVIGVGAGRDLQSALLFGHERVVGIDVNPVFAALLQNEFREFAGLAGRDEIALVTAEARSYLSLSDEQFALVQMSLIDTWAATGAGAFTLSENALYTVEAWRTFLTRLDDVGLFTVSRWFAPGQLGETGRAVSLAVAALLELGVTDPARHIALVSADRVATLLVSRSPLSAGDLQLLTETSNDLAFSLDLLPGVTPENEVLRAIVSAHSRAELREAVAALPLNYAPATDEQPYFFNMLRLSHLDWRLIFTPPEEIGVVRGNLVATLTLLGLIVALAVIALATVIVPLRLQGRREEQARAKRDGLWPGALYFALIGAGFMFVEVALLQRLSIFLSHPAYSLGILLFTIIASTGLGAFLSEYLPLSRSPWIYIYPAAATVAVVLTRFFLPPLVADLLSASLALRIGVAVAVMAPLGIILGLFFPAGMRLARLTGDDQTPWFWALNGIFGVLSSALAVFVSIYVSISASFYVAALCYLAVLIPARRMVKAGPPHAELAVTRGKT